MASHSITTPTTPASEARRSALALPAIRKHLPAALALVAILAAAGWFAGTVVADVLSTLPADVKVAVVIGAVFAIVVGAGVSALLFYSSRAGFDEAADLGLRRDEPPAERWPE